MLSGAGAIDQRNDETSLMSRPWSQKSKDKSGELSLEKDESITNDPMIIYTNILAHKMTGNRTSKLPSEGLLKAQH